MKKILSFILCAVMLASVLVFDASAATLIHSDNFDMGFAPRNWITDQGTCAFDWDSETGTIYGYSDAVVLQSQFGKPYDRQWDKFYASFDFQIKADDDNTEEGEEPNSSIALWYRDIFETEPSGAVYMYEVNIQSGEATLNKSHSYSYKDDKGVTRENSINEIIAGPTNIGVEIEVGEDAAWNNIGIRVDAGKIQCYFNEQLIFSLEANENDEKVGGVALHNVDSTVGSQKSAVLFWNMGNWIALDNFEVWSADYNFVDEIINYGDADGNGSINLLDVSAMMKHIAGWENVGISEAAADVDCNESINLLDVSLVMKAIAKWEVVLGPQA